MPPTPNPRPAGRPRGARVAPLQCTGATVRRLARRITTFYDHYLQPVGVTLSQYSLLAHLSETPQSLREIALRLETDRTTLTRNLEPLLARGWAAEIPGADARRRLLVLTPGGRQVRRSAREAWKKAQLALAQTLGGDKRVAALHVQLDGALDRLKPLLPEDN